MFKLELGPTGQFASRGNVCIFPQDPGPFLQVMPPPLSLVCGEICVLLVGSPDTVVTASMLDNSPLLVRRSHIVAALLWLQQHNPLYRDLVPSAVVDNASEYPESGVPIPVKEFCRVSGSSEGSSYTQRAHDEQFASVGRAGMPSCTVVDADCVDSTRQQAKLAALEVLKNSALSYADRKKAATDILKTGTEPYVKFPSGLRPLSTYQDPRVYGYLWPTLFPYGVGMMEYKSISSNQEAPFRKVDLKTHVSHL
ncbi:hypothetical protein DFH08DRAFT_678333, partial [Mycena albidolilacea]